MIQRNATREEKSYNVGFKMIDWERVAQSSRPIKKMEASCLRRVKCWHLAESEYMRSYFAHIPICLEIDTPLTGSTEKN